MRLKSIAFALFSLFSVVTMAQTTGMTFEHHTTWAAIKEKAKKENKYIFMDAFTTWCGPCKMMAAKIFPLPEVGEFFNAGYINVKVQLDTTKNDNDEVKSWYKDAHDIMVNYKVKVFPTYLFFSPDGELVHRAVGSSDAKAFINKGKDALDPDKQYYTLAKKYDAGNREPDFLRNLSKSALNAYDKPAAEKYADAYLATQTNLLTEDNILFLQSITQTSKDKGFDLMLKNPAAFDAVLGKGKSGEIVRNIILQEEVFPEIFGKNRNSFKWEDLDTKLVTKYPGLGQEISSYAKVFYYEQQGNWEKFAPAVTEFMSKYGASLSPSELNSFAWTIFENCEDMNCVAQALEWSKRSFAAEQNSMFMDTYANLLYKLGKKEDAIKAQENTIAVARAKGDANLKDYEETLSKMKTGEKTW